MTKKYSRIIAVIMLVIAIVFIFIALNNPQASFPWSNAITYILYGVYSTTYYHQSGLIKLWLSCSHIIKHKKMSAVTFRGHFLDILPKRKEVRL